ncbi:MAG: tryptophan--tRNA ligase [Candidatus Micrarchaeota archaeon]|nr:tryptophan--tRNA ligase [Candidatus Micrarchaeota archaeon]
MATEKIDPWSSTQAFDYLRLFEQFGLSHISDELSAKANFHLIRRQVIFAHRDFDLWLKDALEGKPVAVMSGIKPSSEFHLGSKLTADEMIFFQKKFGAHVFYSIADLEAFADNNLSLEESFSFAVSNLADFLALGLDPKKSFVYLQSQEKRVMNMAYIFSKRATPALLTALYGQRNYSLYFAALTQVGDILLPQHRDFGGPKRTLVPVGIDQDPHIRFARDIAFKEKLLAPSAIYHKLMRGLRGEAKMSKRDASSVLSLSDSQEEAKRKLASTLTGGRATAEEQRKLGGQIENCVFYEIMRYHFLLDEHELEKMRQDCVSGAVLCGDCKACYSKKVLEWLAKHQEKKKKMLPLAKKLLKKD